jgi:hypothetical protein
MNTSSTATTNNNIIETHARFVIQQQLKGIISVGDQVKVLFPLGQEPLFGVISQRKEKNGTFDITTTDTHQQLHDIDIQQIIKINPHSEPTDLGYAYYAFCAEIFKTCKGELAWVSPVHKLLHLVRECPILTSYDNVKAIIITDFMNILTCPVCIDMISNDPNRDMYRRAVRRREGIRLGFLLNRNSSVPMYRDSKCFHVDGGCLAASRPRTKLIDMDSTVFRHQLKKRKQKNHRTRRRRRCGKHQRRFGDIRNYKRKQRVSVTKRSKHMRRMVHQWKKLYSLPICVDCYDRIWKLMLDNPVFDSAFPLHPSKTLNTTIPSEFSKILSREILSQ